MGKYLFSTYINAAIKVAEGGNLKITIIQLKYENPLNICWIFQVQMILSCLSEIDDDDDGLIGSADLWILLFVIFSFLLKIIGKWEFKKSWKATYLYLVSNFKTIK